MKYAAYEAPAWKNIWSREREAAEARQVCRISYDTLIAVGQDYTYAMNTHYGKFHGITPDYNYNYPAYDASSRYYKALEVLDVASDLAQVPKRAIIQAARIANRYYDTGAMQCLDAERLIKSLL